MPSHRAPVYSQFLGDPPQRPPLLIKASYRFLFVHFQDVGHGPHPNPFQGLKQGPVFRPKVVHFEVTRGGALWVIGDTMLRCS
jgi:hypothetical protein